jgi:sugar O-acyltransferase (sialic acid O-acetyltransferase NeuD family)
MIPGSRKILLIGAGGHCLSVLDSLLGVSNYACIGIIDKEGTKNSGTGCAGKKVLDIPVIGSDDDLVRLHEEGFTDAFITVGSIKDCTVRMKLYELVKQIGYHVPNIIDKSSTAGSGISLGEGIYIGKNSVVNAGSRIGNCAIINTSSIIEHECRIGDFVHIAPGAILCGNVQIGKESHIGAGSMIKQGVHIGSGVMIGMGSVVLKDIRDHVTAYGNPCREVSNE